MAATGELHLIVPGVCGPLADTETLKSSTAVKDWTGLLSRAHCRSSSSNIHEVIASLFNLSIAGDFPSAALSLLANDQYDPAMSYMCADPVHLQADLDSAILTSSVDLDIMENESAALCEALNQHFFQDGLRFIRLGKDDWIVASKDEIQVSTTPLSEATGRNVNFILPKDRDATSWKQVLTEAQMLMHTHDVNEQREKQGRQPVNSLWFHGSGKLPVTSACRVSSVCSNKDIFKGLARYVQCEYLPQTASVDEYLAYLTAGSHSINVLHLADMEHLVNYTDVTPWLDTLANVVEHWIYPLIKAANRNNFRVVLYPCNEKQYQFSRFDALKFWRQHKIEKHVNSY